MKSSFAAALVLLALSGLPTGPAWGADAAERAILGFSPDGRWFAFEEYGVQDGSGAPYANIYVIDLDHDRWAEGSPVRVRLDSGSDDQPPVSAARRKAEAEAAPLLGRLGIGEPGIVLGSNPPTEVNEESFQLTVREHYNLTTAEHTLAFNIQVFNGESAEPCPDPAQGPKGFALIVARGFGPRQELYRDGPLPSSRGCPIGYGLADVIRYDSRPAGREPRFVVLIHVYRYGFEGSDVRFIAVPVTLP